MLVIVWLDCILYYNIFYYTLLYSIMLYSLGRQLESEGIVITGDLLIGEISADATHEVSCSISDFLSLSSVMSPSYLTLGSYWLCTVTTTYVLTRLELYVRVLQFNVQSIQITPSNDASKRKANAIIKLYIHSDTNSLKSSITNTLQR
jgi:hypothetical protein